MNDERMSEWTVREYQAADIPAWVEAYNAEYPDEPTTIEQEEYWERSYPQENPRLRMAVEDGSGQFTGMASCEKPFWAAAPGVYVCYALVRRDCRRQGIGRAVLARLERFARNQRAEKLWADCRESQAHSVAFLQANGFRQFGYRFEQALDLEQFDRSRFPGAQERIRQQGYRLTNLAEFQKVRPDADRLLYEVFRETAFDVPLPGGAHVSIDFDQWRKELDSPTTDPAFIFLALYGDEVVGETALELLKDGPAITSSTGVRRDHRGRGVALALKLASLEALRQLGYKEARTHNDTENPAILHLNEKIGYRRLPGWTEWEKLLE
jgi:mycothiol synthase